MPDEPAQLDPVVVEAMKELTAWTYQRYQSPLRNWRQRRKGMDDPSSRSGAIHIFKNLKYHGFLYDPEELQAWARGHGWRSPDVVELGVYAGGVLAGTRYHTVPDPFGQGAINRWKEAAA
jgi:hypothetical protein